MTKFRVGDKVWWASQAKGVTRTKHGVVAEVVPSGRIPDREAFPSLHKHAGCGLPRDHQSYVVLVKNRQYWPRVMHLKPVCPEHANQGDRG